MIIRNCKCQHFYHLKMMCHHHTNYVVDIWLLSMVHYCVVLTLSDSCNGMNKIISYLNVFLVWVIIFWLFTITNGLSISLHFLFFFPNINFTIFCEQGLILVWLFDRRKLESEITIFISMWIIEIFYTEHK